MIHDLQLYRFGRKDKGACQQLVLFAGLNITVGVIVGQHEGCRPAPQSRLNHSARVNVGSVDGAFF